MTPELMKYFAALLALINICCLLIYIALVVIYRKRIAEIDAIAHGPSFRYHWWPLILLHALQYGMGAMFKSLATRHRPHIDYSKIAPETLRPLRLMSIIFIIGAVSMFGTIALRAVRDFSMTG